MDGTSDSCGTDSAADTTVVLYGHNMRDGSMFAGLHRYRRKGFAKEHPAAYLYTDSGLHIYHFVRAEIVSAEAVTASLNDATGLVMITCAGNEHRLVTVWEKAY